jgi:hypothetical protein
MSVYGKPELSQAQQQIQQQKATYGNQAQAEATVQTVRNLPSNARNVQVTSVPMAGPLRPGEQRPSVTQVSYELPTEQRMIKPLNDPFGASLAVWNPSTGAMKEQIGYDPKSNAPVFATVKYNVLGGTASPAENQALLGITVASVVAGPILMPKLLPFAIGAPAVAETVKYGATGQHLTVEETLGAASIGELVGVAALSGASLVNQKYVKPSVERSISSSYEAQQRANIEALQPGKDPWEVPDTQTWRPTPVQRLGMKVTGARVNFHMAESTFPVSSYQNSPQFMGNDAAFDFAIAPKASYVGLNKGLLPSQASIMASQSKPLPLYFGLGGDTFEQLPQGDFQYVWDKPEKGLPESQLAYDYRGSLAFKRPSAFEQIAAMRQEGGGGMKNIFGKQPVSGKSIMSEPSYGEGGYSVSLLKEQTSGLNFNQPMPRMGMGQAMDETQVLSYPQFSIGRGMTQETKPVTARQEQSQFVNRMVTPTQFSGVAQKNLVMVNTGIKQSQNPMSMQDSLLREEAVTDLASATMQKSFVVNQTEKTSLLFSGEFGMPKSLNPFAFPPGLKFEGSGFSSPFLGRTSGIGKRIRYYPVADPLDMGSLF